jgi:hypothetical protein
MWADGFPRSEREALPRGGRASSPGRPAMVRGPPEIRSARCAMDQGDLAGRRRDVAVGMPTARTSGETDVARPRADLPMRRNIWIWSASWMAWLRSSRFSASNRSSKVRSLCQSRPPRSLRGPLLRIGASSRTEADFLSLDRVARAIPLIEDSPQISWLRLNSPVPDRTALSPMRTHNDGRAILSLNRLTRSKTAAVAGLTCGARATSVTQHKSVRSRTATSHHVTERTIS